MFLLIGCALAMAAIGYFSGPSAIKSQARQIATSLAVAGLAIGAKYLVLRFGDTNMNGTLLLLLMLGAFVAGLMLRSRTIRRS